MVAKFLQSLQNHFSFGTHQIEAAQILFSFLIAEQITLSMGIGTNTQLDGDQSSEVLHELENLTLLADSSGLVYSVIQTSLLFRIPEDVLLQIMQNAEVEDILSLRAVR